MKVEIKLDGESIKIKKGALHKQLKVPADYKFKLPELRRINKTDNGDLFSFKGKTFKMTPLMKKRITLAITLMK